MTVPGEVSVHKVGSETLYRVVKLVAHQVS